MITVFGHLDGTGTSGSCVSVIFQGGPNGGSVTFTLCGGTKTSRLTLGVNQNSFQLCVENNSWTFSDFFMGAALQGTCSSSGGGGLVTDNAFTIERTSDGFSTYAQLNSSFAVNQIVAVSNDLTCYEIMGTAVVSDPSIFPTVTSLCSSGGSGSGKGNGIGPI